MFNEDKIKELAQKGLLRNNFLNLNRYTLIKDDNIETKYLNLEINLWSNGDITFRDIIDVDKCCGDFINNKITGKGSKIYREDIKEAIDKFNDKYKKILDYIKDIEKIIY